MQNALRKEAAAPIAPFQANKWVLLQDKIKDACNKWTEEDLRLYECAALTSWESR
jgi:hypothetical protein